MFIWYTVDSNVLQLLVSAAVVYYCVKDKPLPAFLTILHFISAVALTVTFLIVAFVLAPAGGIGYYFLQNVAPINHFIGPLLSVISLLFLEDVPKMSIGILCWPVAYSLFYGIVCLILNIFRVIDGPYFFLQVYEQSVFTIILWFAIVAIICFIFSCIYYRVKWRKQLKEMNC